MCVTACKHTHTNTGTAIQPASQLGGRFSPALGVMCAEVSIRTACV